MNPAGSAPAARERARLVLSDCPGCDAPVPLEGLALNEVTRCPECGSSLLLVRIDGVLMLFRDGWT